MQSALHVLCVLAGGGRQSSIAWKDIEHLALEGHGRVSLAPAREVPRQPGVWRSLAVSLELEVEHAELPT